MLVASIASALVWADSDPAQAVTELAVAELAETLAKRLEINSVPAAALVVVDVSKPKPATYIRTFGQATPETSFRLGSITKTFTSLALLHFASASQTPLSTPVAPLLENVQAREAHWTNPWRDAHPITLGQLVELSTGFSDISRAEFASAVPLERKQALRQHRSSHRVHWPPGRFHSYSNLPPAFSAVLIETLSGTSFDAYLHANVLTPLGMPTASLRPLSTLPGGYRADGQTPIPYWHTIYPAFGALNATPAEFANFLQILASNSWPKPLADAIALRGSLPVYQPATTAAARAGLELGYGAGMYGWQTRGHLFAGHGGDADGYRARYAVLPEHKRAYFFVINVDNPRLMQRLRQRVESALVADLPIPQASLASKSIGESPLMISTAQQAQHFAGRYSRATSRFGRFGAPGTSNANATATKGWQCSGDHAKLTVRDGQFYWNRGQGSQRLFQVADNLYRRKSETMASIALVSIDGKPHLVGELGNWVKVNDPDNCSD